MPRRILLILALPLLLPFVLAARCDGKDVQEHVLNRIGYGPDAWTLSRYQALGPRAYVEEQLLPHLIDDSALETDLMARYPSLSMVYSDLRRIYHEYSSPAGGPTRVRRELGMAKILRAVYSHRQLEQVLTDFWFNHLNVSVRRDLARWSTTPYEREAIRPHVLGRFEDMLKASAHSLAMINYLDNQHNYREGYMIGAQVLGINENYGRELLELHSVGPDAGYTLDDIQNVARAFTGWSTYTFSSLPAVSDGFLYIDAAHDKGAKSVMGELFIPAGGGIEDGEMVLEYLAAHPATAERVARKLCARFVSEPPPEALVQQAKNVFLSTDGDLYQVTRTILLSSEFLNATNFRAKVKRPLAFIATAARAVGVTDRETFAVAALTEIEKLGEPLFEAEPPTGFPEASSAWISTGTFLRRVNYAHSAASGSLGFAPLPAFTGTAEQITDQLIAMFLTAGASTQTRDATIGVVQAYGTSVKVRQGGSMVLASPEFLSQ